MAVATSPGGRLDNRLLAALPAEEYERFLPQLERVAVRTGDALHEPDVPISHVYFPVDSVVSLVSNMQSGATAAVGMIGNEGFVGLPVFLGGDKASNRAIVQIAGTAWRCKARAFKDAVAGEGALSDLLHRYTQAQLTQTSQTAACNCFHLVEERLARFLLSVHDRTAGDELPLTQDVISQMLGVRRSGITVAAGKLQEAELIAYTRGQIRILDRVSLEAASCECYEVTKAEFDRLLLADLAGKRNNPVTSTGYRQSAPRKPDARLHAEPRASAGISAARRDADERNADRRNTDRRDADRRDAERRRAGRRQEDKEHAERLEMMRDVNTRLVLAGIREQEARDKAEAADRAKDEFLATLSHELRTPLTSMLGWTRMLRTRDFDKVTAARALAIIERNAEAQQRLIEDILNMSRIVAGKLRIDVAEVDLRSVVETAADGVRPTAEAQKVELRTRLDAEAVYVNGDAARLQQIVWNLLTNAIKFTPSNGSVEVRLTGSDSHARITVSDTGQGISPEFLPHVFDRFRQADNSSTRPHGGLGLGLAIVRHLTELHGGTIRAESPGEGSGATFTVELPLALDDIAADDSGHDNSPLDNVATSFNCAASLDGLRVLIVEDESDTREVLVAMLENCKASVTAVSTVRGALDAIDEIKPHVILSDIGMPGEDGYELIRRLRARENGKGARIPAAALTAYASEDDRERALAAGYQVHLPKPIKPSRLVAVVAHLAGRI